MRPSPSSARVQAAVDSPARADASAVAELAIEPVPGRTAASWKRAASHRPLPRLRTVGRLMMVVVALTAGASLLLAIAHTNERERVQERLRLGCLDVADCRALVHSLEASQKACWFSCAGEIEMVSRGRVLFRDALERNAAREKALQDAAFERLRSEEREQERVRAATARAEARTLAERQHRHTLERLAAEAE